MDSSPSGTGSPDKFFLSELLLVTAFYHINRNETHMPFMPVTAEFLNILQKPVLFIFLMNLYSWGRGFWSHHSLAVVQAFAQS